LQTNGRAIEGRGHLSTVPDLERLVSRSKESTPSGLGYSISLYMRAGCVRCESGVLLLRVQGSLPLVTKLQRGEGRMGQKTE
jgi:hypothetical protein